MVRFSWNARSRDQDARTGGLARLELAVRTGGLGERIALVDADRDPAAADHR